MAQQQQQAAALPLPPKTIPRRSAAEPAEAAAPADAAEPAEAAEPEAAAEQEAAETPATEQPDIRASDGGDTARRRVARGAARRAARRHGAKAASPLSTLAVVGSWPAAADRSFALGSFFLESLSANFFGGAGGFFISGEEGVFFSGEGGVERTPSTVWLAPREGARRRLAGGGDELRGRARLPKVRPSGAHSDGTGLRAVSVM